MASHIAKHMNEALPHIKETASAASDVPSAKDIELFQNLLLENEKERGFIVKKMKGIVSWMDRIASLKITQQAVADVEKKLAKSGDKPFLGGDLPAPADVAAFHKLLGEGNTAVYRWVKHMASFSAEEAAKFAEEPNTKDATVFSANK